MCIVIQFKDWSNGFVESVAKKFAYRNFQLRQRDNRASGVCLIGNFWTTIRHRREAKDTFKAIAGAVLGGSGLLGIHLFILPADFIIPFAAQIIGVLMLAIAAMIRGFSTTARRARAIRV